VTLNDLERRNGVILRYFSKFGKLPGALRKSSRSLSHLLMSSSLVTNNISMKVNGDGVAGIATVTRTVHLLNADSVSGGSQPSNHTNQPGL